MEVEEGGDGGGVDGWTSGARRTAFFFDDDLQYAFTVTVSALFEAAANDPKLLLVATEPLGCTVYSCGGAFLNEKVRSTLIHPQKCTAYSFSVFSCSASHATCLKAAL